jgi:aminoglycoside 3-N-acetyltransferase
MSENSVISNTQSPITVTSISHNLSGLGVKSGDTLLVHSSLSSLGWVCGGAQAVIEALLKTLGADGTLVMPAHSGDWSDPSEWQNPPVPKEWMPIIRENMPAFDPEKTPTRGIGRISELFRKFPNTVRSNHPQVSFCANGKRAKEITVKHSLTPQFGVETPLGRLYQQGAKVLMLGVGYDNCSCFHMAETLISKMPMMKTGAAIFENSTRVWKPFEDFDYNTDDFEQIGKSLENASKVTKGNVGNAKCKLLNLTEAVDFAKQWIATHRFAS